MDVVIGIGTNLGDRLANVRRGVRGLAARPELTPTAVSPIYESDALLPPDAPPDWHQPYLNLAVRARWAAASPEPLVALLKQLETEAGREPSARWAPRGLDLDLLAFGTRRIHTERLTVPHAGLLERPFALLPLADVWADWVFPDGPAAGRRAADVARPWRASPAHVPLRTRRTALSLTAIVGALNVTPDSFSDGGLFFDAGLAVQHAERMVSLGAEVVDVGAESTRPGGSPVDPDVEWRRLEPVLRALDRSIDRPISVDTRHAGVARRAVDAGARWINDVTGLTDPTMVDVARCSTAEVVVMHSLSIPPTRDHTIPPDADPVTHLRAWATARLDELGEAGIAKARIILDPGVGFGKTPAQSTALVRGADLFRDLGVRTLIGHSRKSFFQSWFPPGHPAIESAGKRDLESALVTAHLGSLGVEYVRVHDVDGAARALRAAALVGRPVPLDT